MSVSTRKRFCSPENFSVAGFSVFQGFLNIQFSQFFFFRKGLALCGNNTIDSVPRDVVAAGS